MVFVVVTTDGILLTKSGTMTGGTSGGMEARSHKWDDKKIEGLLSNLTMLCTYALPFFYVDVKAYFML